MGIIFLGDWLAVTIYVLDMRYTTIKLNEFFKKVGATDILFGSSISSFYTSSRVDGIRAIMQ